MKIALISCVKSKLPHKARAEDLYTSPLFKGSLQYARSFRPDAIYILSAKHGLLELDDIVEPYEETLNGKRVGAIRLWSEGVLHELSRRHDLKADEFIFLAGVPYRRFLLPAIRHHQIPLEGMDFGSQLSFYARQASRD